MAVVLLHRARREGERDEQAHCCVVQAANNYADTLNNLRRFEEAKAFLPRAIPVTRRTLGESHYLTLSMRSIYANALWQDDGATLDDDREAVTTLEDVERIARRVMGGAHPTTKEIARDLRNARAALRAREPPNR